MNKKSQNGNAIIMILIAVALFAALGYAFSNTSRTSTSLITDEEATAYANQIIAYGSEVKNVVKRLKLSGCTETEISFENSTVVGYANPNAPGNNSCHVFDSNGGGLSYRAPSDQYGDGTEWIYTGRAIVLGIKSDDLTAPGGDQVPTIWDGKELILVLHKIDDSLCLKINDSLEIDGIPIDSDDLNIERFVGTYVTGNDAITGCPTNSKLSCPSGTWESSVLWAKRAGCFEEGATGDNVFYTVLFPR